MVKVALPGGNAECLLANLEPQESSTADIAKLHQMRRGIETAFDMLKNKLAIENFTGAKPILIEQDIYSTIYVCNLAQDLIADAEAGLAAQADAPARKHPVAVNKPFPVGTLKGLPVKATLTGKYERRNALTLEMVALAKREVLPARPGRHFERAKSLLCGKFSNSNKRAF